MNGSTCSAVKARTRSRTVASPAVSRPSTSRKSNGSRGVVGMTPSLRVRRAGNFGQDVEEGTVAFVVSVNATDGRRERRRSGRVHAADPRAGSGLGRCEGRRASRDVRGIREARRSHAGAGAPDRGRRAASSRRREGRARTRRVGRGDRRTVHGDEGAAGRLLPRRLRPRDRTRVRRCDPRSAHRHGRGATRRRVPRPRSIDREEERRCSTCC